MATVKLSQKGSELLQPQYAKGARKQFPVEAEEKPEELEDAEEGDAQQPVVNSELTRKILRTLQPRSSARPT